MRDKMEPDWAPPAWEELSDEQRANIRKTNEENRQYMADLGEAIRTGGPYPDLPK